jgi:hypothetical protein
VAALEKEGKPVPAELKVEIKTTIDDEEEKKDEGEKKEEGKKEEAKDVKKGDAKDVKKGDGKKMMTTDDSKKESEKKEEEKKEEEKKKVEADLDALTPEEKEEVESEADKKYDIELEALIGKIIEKSLFLIKMQVPQAYKIKEKKAGGTLIFIKDSIDEQEPEHDWRDRLK